MESRPQPAVAFSNPAFSYSRQPAPVPGRALLGQAVVVTGTSAAEDGAEDAGEEEEDAGRGEETSGPRCWCFVGIINCFISALIRACPIARLSKYERRNPRGDV